MAWIALAAALAWIRSAAAQGMCEEDAGSACEDDGGVDMPDGGGLDPGRDGGVGGRGDAGGFAPPPECSCETDLDRDGRIHVCTQSLLDSVCESFDCERGTVFRRPCPTTEVELCCEMPSRGLSTVLYDDCTHPNCESGFREQCADFGGTIREGACEQDRGGGDGDGDGGGGFCAAAPATSARRTASGLLLALLPALAWLRRRARHPG